MNKQKNFNRNLATKRRLAIQSLVVGVIVMSAISLTLWVAQSANKTWTGASLLSPTPALRNNLWTNELNWSNNVAPLAGDDLTFGSSLQQASQNNFANGTTFNSLAISSGHTIQGAGIALNAGISATNANILLSSIKLNNAQSFDAPVSGVGALINTAIDNNGKTLQLSGPGNFTIPGAITGTGGLVKVGGGTTILVGSNTYTGTTSVNGGNLLVFGSQSSSSVAVAHTGVLGGSGTVGPVTVQSDVNGPSSNSNGLLIDAARVSPGNLNPATGVLNVGDITFITLPGAFESLSINLNGTVVGTGYDQLSVTGSVNLGSTTMLELVPSFVPPAGSTFIIVNNDGTDAINGSFFQLAEGSVFSTINASFLISYKGGDGNDVSLHVPETKQWSGAGNNNLWTNGANWVGGSKPQAGDILSFVNGASRLSNVNDFPAGTVFTQIAISGGGYQFTGNSIALINGINDSSGPQANSIFGFNAIKLNGDQTFNKTNPFFMNMNSAIDTNGRTLTLDGAGSKNFQNPITGSGGLIVNGSGDTQFFGGDTGAHTYSGNTVVNSGSFTVFRDVTNSPIQLKGGVLSGNHTVKSITGTGGTLRLDNDSGPPLTTSGDVTLNPAVNVAVALSNLGQPFSRGLTVGGTVSLGNCILTPEATFNGGVPAGTVLIIINKISAGAVQGTFNNLPEGAAMMVGGAQLFITYVGGDGNDVVLHSLTTRTWDGGGTTNNWTEPANWVGDVAPLRGDDLAFPAGAARFSNTNDFPGGTTFGSISLSGGGYVLGGNSVTLAGGINDSAATQSNQVGFSLVTLAANQTFTKVGAGTLNVQSQIGTNGKTLTVDGSGSKELRGVMSGSGAVIVNGTGSVDTIHLGNNSYTGPTTINSGSFILGCPTSNSVFQLNGGVLTGSGSINSIVATGGKIRRGFQGTATTSNNSVTLNSAVTFEVEIHREAGALSSGLLNVGGALNLGNSILSVVPTFVVTPSPGETFNFINKTSAGPIQGIFNGLPENSLLTIGGVLFRLSYVGGDGNDVTLTVTSARRWDGGSAVNGSWTTKENWEGDVAPLPGDDLEFPAGAGRLGGGQDFPNGTVFNSITISGTGYDLFGEGLSLNAGMFQTATSGAGTLFGIPIKLNANQTFAVSNVLTMYGGVDTNGKTLTFDGPGTLVMAGAFVGGVKPITGSGGIIRTGSGTTILAQNNTYTGVTNVLSGTLDINGNQSSSPVNISSGVLTAGGTTGAITATGGKVHIGSTLNNVQTPTLNCVGNVSLSASSTFETELRSAVSKFAQLNVTGTVALGSSTLSVVAPFAPTDNSAKIINNDGADPINGSFAGLPEGSVLTANGRQFRISYMGGDGNDVVLTVVAAPSIQFSTGTMSVGEGDLHVNATITRTGDATGPSTVRFSTSDASGSQACNVANGVASSKCDYETSFRTIQFASGEVSKSVDVFLIDDAYLEGPETFTLSLSSPTGASLGATTTANVSITDNELATGVNPIDNADFFVRQHYLDFFTREPDPGGFAFWTNQINSCTNQQCIEIKRINVSAAFYVSIEFQETGYLVERISKTAYGDKSGTSTFGGMHQLPVPIIRLNEFLSDTQQIGSGVVVGQTGWEQVLENNKVAFTNDFVQRSRFTTALPLSLTPAEFVDRLNLNAGIPLSQLERDQLVIDLASSTKTRAQVLRAIAEDPDLHSGEFNRAFVLMQYFGYLRRNPDEGPDSDHSGFEFWLSKLNQFGGNFIDAEMVKAFITSGEYRQRFGP